MRKWLVWWRCGVKGKAGRFTIADGTIGVYELIGCGWDGESGSQVSEAAPTMNQAQTNTEKEGKQEGETGKQTTRKNTEVTAVTHIPLHFTNAVHC